MAFEKIRKADGRKLALDLTVISHEKAIILCHGFGSDRDSKGRFPAMANSLQRAGFSTVAFDFSGCGESDDAILDVADEVDDVKIILGYLQQRGYKKFGLYGHSLGSLICLKCVTMNIIAMALSGCLTGPMRYDWKNYYSAGQLAKLKQDGSFRQDVQSTGRPSIQIGQNILDTFADIDQKALLQSVPIPVLLIHGDGDEEERELLENSKAGFAYLPEGSRLELLHGATHSFAGQYNTVIEKSTDWFCKHLV